MKIVLDTNVLVSGLLSPQGPPAMILNLVLSGKVTILYDGRIFNEYSEVLRREKFGFTKSMIDPFLDFLKSEGFYINAEPLPGKFSDEDDRMFYETARAGNARFLVTGNTDHFPREGLIIKPKEFLDRYLRENRGM